MTNCGHLPVSIDSDGAAYQYASLMANPYLPDGDRDVQRRVSKMTAAKKRAFCEAIANGASPTRSAKALGVARSTIYYQRSIDSVFAAAWEEAQEQDADRYEDALDDAAIRMKNIGGIIFGLKNKRPGKWQDRKDVKVEQRHDHRHRLELPGTSERELLEIVQAQLLDKQKLLPPPAQTSTTGSQKRGHAS